MDDLVSAPKLIMSNLIRKHLFRTNGPVDWAQYAIKNTTMLVKVSHARVEGAVFGGVMGSFAGPIMKTGGVIDLYDCPEGYMLQPIASRAWV